MKFIVYLIFIINICFCSEEFIISYKAITKNNVLIGEEFNISKALKNTSNYEVIGICDFIDISTRDLDSNLKNILKDNKDTILDCLNKNIYSKIINDIKFIKNAIQSKTTFKIPPQRIIIDTNDNKINMKIIRESI